MKPLLIIGIGNILRTDDGAGVHAVNMLNGSGRLPGWAEAVDAGTSAMDIPYLLEGRERVIIIDAIESDETPGAIFRLPAGQIESNSGAGLSLHGAGLYDAIRAIRMLGGNTDAVEIIGIVPKDVNTIGMELSEPVSDAVLKVVELVLERTTDYQTKKPVLSEDEHSSKRAETYIK